MDAMGNPIPAAAMSKALVAVREMAPDVGTEDAMRVIGRTADRLERDQPYEAMAAATELLDLTGAYRLMATLLAGVA